MSAALRPLTPYRTYVALLGSLLEGCDSVLDVGCGTSSPLRDVPGDFRGVGVDAYAPAIEVSRRAGIHEAYLQQPVTELDVPPASFDAVVMLDLIEHLDRDAALELLARAERAARRRVIVSTPNGFVPQGDVGGNPFQVHRSGWTVAELEARGFRVWGANGPKGLRGERGSLRRPRAATGPLSVLLQPLVVHRPASAFQLVAVKDTATVRSPEVVP
ncbi:MAG: class I SAM-dependent methyltransferase [Actinomycetota bacterium]|jgi:SAM-dependent methyltransferase|nr:class I SAM-dependent methyltransferase [Actinomycetota bacterium]